MQTTVQSLISDLEQARIEHAAKLKKKYIALCVASGSEYSYSELTDMNLVSLRNEVDKLRPVVITQVQSKISGGVRRTAVKLVPKSA